MSRRELKSRATAKRTSSLPSESARPLALPNRVREIFPFHILHNVFVCVCACLTPDFPFVSLRHTNGRSQSAHAANEVAEVAATFNLADSQVFGAIFISLIAGILAMRLGAELYK